MRQSGRGLGSALGGDEKAILRKLILEKRWALSDPDRRDKSLKIQERLLGLPEFTQKKVIHLFLSFRGEVVTDGVVKAALAMGKRVVVPVVRGKTEGLIFSELKRYPDEIEPARLGIPEPKKEFIRKVDLSAIDLFILPGVAFDMQGNRLGYGTGYYDRILGRKSHVSHGPATGAKDSGVQPGVPLIGLAFELQLVESIPASLHDIRVHKIVTEERVIEC